MSSEEKRLDQEWIELLDELRVVLPGTEVLFAFLLTIPFADRFADVARTDKTVYFVAFVFAAVATLLLIAPSAQHRLLWRQKAKNEQLRLATGLAIAGTGFTAIAITAVVFLITNLLYGNALPAVVTAVVIGLIVWFWYGQPLLVRASVRVAPSREGATRPNAER